MGISQRKKKEAMQHEKQRNWDMVDKNISVACFDAVRQHCE